MSVVFVDTETTGLDADRHEIWEVALTRNVEPPQNRDYIWLLPVDLTKADPISLSIGKFHERHPNGNKQSDEQKQKVTPLLTFCQAFARLTHETHLVGAIISFDEQRLRKLMLSQGIIPSWHYHIVDVEAMVAGLYGIEPPWDSNNLSKLVGVDPTEYNTHTALGDALWAQAIYTAVIKTPQQL